MRVENFFLRYAFPCAQIIVQRREISDVEYKELERIAINNEKISKKRLEKVFHRAFEFIESLAKRMNKDKWDIEVIKEYFYNDHNRSICEGEGVYKNAPEMLKELSMVHVATVIKADGEVLTVEYEDTTGNKKQRNVFNSFVPQAKVGDRVRTHYGYAVEVVDSQ